MLTFDMQRFSNPPNGSQCVNVLKLLLFFFLHCRMCQQSFLIPNRLPALLVENFMIEAEA